MARGNGGRRNAQEHGAYAHELILPGESREERGMETVWDPRGAHGFVSCTIHLVQKSCQQILL